MTKSTNNNSVNAAAVAAISAATSFHEMTSKSSLAVISAAVEIYEKLEQNERRSKQNGRYIHNGGIPLYEESVWFKVDKYGDEQDFFHFTSLTRTSFANLVEVKEPVINRLPVNREDKAPSPRNLKEESSMQEILLL